jgi:hypothetical protein
MGRDRPFVTAREFCRRATYYTVPDGRVQPRPDFGPIEETEHSPLVDAR